MSSTQEQLVTSTMITWARKRLGESVESFAKRMDVPVERVTNWESGVEFITYAKVKKLADMSLLPIGLLFLKQPPELSIGMTDFRKSDGHKRLSPSPELYAVVSTMKYRQAWYRDYLQENGCAPLDYVGSVTTDTPIKNAVDRLKTILQWNDDIVGQCRDWESYFDRLTTAMEDMAGILVMRNGVVNNNTSRPLDVREFRGFALADSFAPLVFVNAADSKGAQLFTLVHEAAHVLLGQSGISNNDFEEEHHGHNVERYCNAVAAEFLAPESIIRACWGESQLINNDWLKRISFIARQLKLSRQVILYRCQSLHLIPAVVSRGLWNELKGMEKAKSGSGGNFYAMLKNRVSRMFARMVIAENESGNISFTDAFKLLSVNSAESLRKLSEVVGV